MLADLLPEAVQPQPTAAAPEVFWLLLVGDSKVGKTSLVNRLLTDSFDARHQPTEGAYSKQHPLQLGGNPARLQVSTSLAQQDKFPQQTSIPDGCQQHKSGLRA